MHKRITAVEAFEGIVVNASFGVDMCANGVDQGVGVRARMYIRFRTNVQSIALTNDNVLGKK